MKAAPINDVEISPKSKVTVLKRCRFDFNFADIGFVLTEMLLKTKLVKSQGLCIVHICIYTLCYISTYLLYIATQTNAFEKNIVKSKSHNNTLIINFSKIKFAR